MEKEFGAFPPRSPESTLVNHDGVKIRGNLERNKKGEDPHETARRIINRKWDAMFDQKFYDPNHCLNGAVAVSESGPVIVRIRLRRMIQTPRLTRTAERIR